jgi:NAD(P)H-hydrate repair Nnr-like enzyme with NAD(P)H-hydrate dehydratase domain
MLDLHKRTGLAVLTPHAGELARYLQLEKHEVQENPAKHALHAAALTNCFVLLKGHNSAIASPDGSLRMVENLSSTLSTAGTGDVLAGILGALLAANFETARQNAFADLIELGVQLHSDAAELASQRGPVAALDVAEAVRQVIAEIQ